MGLRQILVSVGFALSLGERPEGWIVVHTLWAELALRAFRGPAGALLYRILLEKWGVLVKNRVALSRPNVTAPALATALESRDVLWNRVTSIVEAATDAAGSTLIPRVREALDQAVYYPV